MYKHLMNQKFDLKRTDGTDENGMPEVIEKKEVSCKITYKNKLIISSTGQQQTTEGNILTCEVVCVGDLITINKKDYTIIAANPLYDFDNVLQAYQAYF